MIVDAHAHYWPDKQAFSPDFIRQAAAARGAEVNLITDYSHYRDNAPDDMRVIVFGGKARLSGLWQNDEVVAKLVAAEPHRYIGFLSLDLTVPDWRDELEHGHQHLGLKGVKLMPMYAGFYPHDKQFDSFWEYVSRWNLPVLLHTGTTFVRQAPLDCTLPRHLDEVARRFRGVRMVLAHLGHPYEGETIAVIRKHPNVHADISALYYRPWQLFQSLMLVQEYGVWEKLLFGTDYPFTTVNDTIAGLRRLCDKEISGFRLDRDAVEALIQRDALALLGLD